MKDTAVEMNGRAAGAARQPRRDSAARRVAELEAENAALRRALAEAGLAAGRVGGPHDAELPRGRAGRADDASEARSAAARAEARHGREMATGRADLAASEQANGALRGANAELAASRAALREGEARWRGLFERMHEGFALCELVYGPDGEPVDFRHIEVNAAWERHTGIPRAVAVGRRVSELVPAEEAAFWIATYARVVETGAPARAERHTPSLGRWFEALAYRTEPGRFAFLFSDVTGRKRAEARRDALVELGDRLRGLRSPAEIAHAAAEIIGRTLGAARAGYAPVTPDGHYLIERDWTEGRAPSATGRFRVSDYGAAYAARLAQGGVVAIADLAGDPLTAAVAANYAAHGARSQLSVPLVTHGRLAALIYVHGAEPRAWAAEEVAFVREVADRAWAAAERATAEEELRAEKARLRLALDASRLGAWELDVVADTAVRSPRHDAIFGYEEPPPVWGFEQAMRHVLPEDRGGVERSFRAAVEGGAEWHFECRIRRVDGEVRWIEARGQPVRNAEGRPVRLLGTVADVTERRRAEERRALLVAELNHRVKNTLAVVQSLAVQTARGAPDLPAFSSAFQARLIALARAHDLLTREDWTGAPLDALVRAALAPLAIGGARMDLSGCSAGAVLPPGAALALAMALHELATNALKHGALSVPDGRVRVACRAAAGPADAAPVVEWVERGGPPVAGPPAKRGFGLRLLGRALAADGAMGADIRFEPEGVRCTLRPPPAR